MLRGHGNRVCIDESSDTRAWAQVKVLYKEFWACRRDGEKVEEARL